MSATTTWSDLPGLTVKHAQILERRSRAGVQRVENANAFFRAANHLFSPLLRALASMVCRAIDAQTLKMADQAVWFQGVKGGIENGALRGAEQAAIDLMAVQLERAQAAVMELRSAALPLVEQFSQFNQHSRVAQSFRHQLSAMSDLFDAMEAARWAILECEADADMAAGNVKSFDSVDQLLADLTS